MNPKKSRVQLKEALHSLWQVVLNFHFAKSQEKPHKMFQVQTQVHTSSPQTWVATSSSRLATTNMWAAGSSVKRASSLSWSLASSRRSTTSQEGATSRHLGGITYYRSFIFHNFMFQEKIFQSVGYLCRWRRLTASQRGQETVRPGLKGPTSP